ncbi:MAG: adenylosuccinate synthase [Thermomicrobiales bacterium]|nr:adenylosuccinate synthase [Thermomicrobiales bacterium]
MPATIVMGGQWGDEGKGKLTDALAAEADLVVRANGGANAGHTVATDRGIFKLHLVPSGILNPDCVCIVGSGVVVNLDKLLREMDDLRARGIALDNLRIAERAHVVMPYHPMLDSLEEARRADDEIGTTRTGNGPAYADKAARRGIRVADLLDEATLGRKLDYVVAEKNAILTAVYGAEPIDPEALRANLVAAGRRLAPYVVPAETVVQDALDEGREVIVECAQGALLDVDYGTYPYVTSSSPTAAGACQGAGVAPTQVRRVLAVYKAYSTRVGAGPLPAELHDETGALIRERGREYGTTTGRPRRTGWFDAVAARAVARTNGVTEIALTLLDVLDAFEEIEVCTAYRLGDRIITHLPARDDELARVEPIYETLPGWRSPTPAARSVSDLPQGALDYIAFLEKQLGAPIALVGVGPDREQLVPLRSGVEWGLGRR